MPERTYSPLVTLRAGGSNSPSLFCVPGAGDNVFGFAQLANALEKGWRIYGLQPRGLDGALVPQSTVSAAAESYLQAINEIHPRGPVHLLGHSFGGWVAFEIAQRLHAAGRPVASLTLLDSEVPDADDAAIREYDRTEAVMQLIDIFEEAAERPLGISVGDLASRDDEAQCTLLHQQLVRVGLIPRRSTPDILRGPLRAFAASLRTHYKPEQAYPDPVRLVLLDSAKLDDEANRRQRERSVNGWKHRAPNLHVSHGPGNHMTALKPPHVDAIAALLEGNLETRSD